MPLSDDTQLEIIQIVNKHLARVATPDDSPHTKAERKRRCCCGLFRRGTCGGLCGVCGTLVWFLFRVAIVMLCFFTALRFYQRANDGPSELRGSGGA